MVRARVVGHPSEWGQHSGYNEIQSPRKRYSLIDHEQLTMLLGREGLEDLIGSHANWVEEALEQEAKMRDAKWSSSVAVGSEEFVDNTIEELGPLFSKRKAASEDEQYELHDPQAPYISRSTVVGEQSETTNVYEW